MADCTHTRPALRALVGALALALACGSIASVARADGDPASDVLASQALFVPQDANVTEAQRGQLEAMLRAVARAGYPLRVAIIAAPTDLGSIGALFNHPATYGQLLAGELRFIYRGPVMVVMPDRFAVFDGARALVGGPSSSALGATAVAAVREFADSADVTLPASSAVAASATGNTSDLVAWLVFALGAIAIAAAWAASLRARPLHGPH